MAIFCKSTNNLQLLSFCLLLFLCHFFKELRVNLKHKIQILAYYVNTDVLLAIEKSLGVILQVDTQPAYDNDADEVPDE